MIRSHLVALVRSPTIGRLAVLVAILALALSPARADHDGIRFEPAHPSWQDAVTIVVDTDDRGCGLAHLEGPDFVLDGDSETFYAIEVEVVDGCAVGIPSPFSVTLTTVLDPIRFGPGEYPVRVRHEETGHVTETSLEVFEMADEALDVVRPARSDEPLEVTLEAFGPCPHLFPPVIEENDRRIVLEYSDECHILPPDPTVHTVRDLVGPLAPGGWTIVVIDRFPRQVVREEVVVHDAAGCVPSETRLCLNQGRFSVEASWRDFEGGSGVAHARPLADLHDSGLLWFFEETNLELTVKVLEACPVNGHWWVFLSSGSTVEYEVTVTDTLTGASRTYDNASGELPALVPDTAAFACL